ncbi:hypothetical protein LO749_12070 [Paracoccus denitrificans]|nr:hypothetical protein LO749_12070 [Paracoccus denitrificans]
MNAEIVARLEVSFDEATLRDSEQFAQEAVYRALDMLREAGALDMDKMGSVLKRGRRNALSNDKG